MAALPGAKTIGEAVMKGVMRKMAGSSADNAAIGAARTATNRPSTLAAFTRIWSPLEIAT
ncbi:MAG TPA: hypothetical protein VGT40_23750 [Methylomirabilota bacterium]|nr:hypothetical protein [Methylomirabilota bacterium]